MITKMQGKTFSRGIVIRKEPGLSALEKAMLKWMVVDPEDRILDANVGSGMMAEYLRRNMRCEVCGVSDNMEHVRYARSRLQTCDIVYAAPGDIPWRDEAFDIVLMKTDGEEPETLERMFTEAERVLRPGGQMILGAVSYPAIFQNVAGLFADASADEKHHFNKKKVEEMLSRLSFEALSWQRTGFGTGILIAWKAKPGAKQVRLEH